MDWKIQEVFKKLRDKVNERYDDKWETLPLYREILEALRSPKFKPPPNLEINDGIIDLVDHVATFQSIMELVTISNMLCKVFPITLKKYSRR